MVNNQAKSTLLQLKERNPFDYALDVRIAQAPQQGSCNQVTICCHGYGHNSSIVDMVNSLHVIPGCLVSFNFPDHDITESIDHRKSAFGTIKEILPLLYLIKRCAVDFQVPILNLYGFSAGGGAIVNALAILNSNRYEQEIGALGISAQAKVQMIRALERGCVLLDCPLKSIEEIIALRGHSSALDAMQKHFAENNMRPIDTVSALAGLKLTIVLHFQNDDATIGTRDSTVFVQRLTQANGGRTYVTSGLGGHVGYHGALWDTYKKLQIS